MSKKKRKEKKRKEKVEMYIDATLELEAEDLAGFDDVAIEELEPKIFEIMESVVPVAFIRGTSILHGKIRFISPNSYQLKVARLEFLDKTNNSS